VYTCEIYAKFSILYYQNFPYFEKNGFDPLLQWAADLKNCCVGSVFHDEVQQISTFVQFQSRPILLCVSLVRMPVSKSVDMCNPAIFKLRENLGSSRLRIRPQVPNANFSKNIFYKNIFFTKYLWKKSV
jgi:hypothetical protein